MSTALACTQALGFPAWRTAAGDRGARCPQLEPCMTSSALQSVSLVRSDRVTSCFGLSVAPHDVQEITQSSASERGTSLLCFCPRLQSSFATDYFETPMRATPSDFQFLPMLGCFSPLYLVRAKILASWLVCLTLIVV